MEPEDKENVCPEEVAQAVLAILRTAILSIRVAGWGGQAEYCALEADHIHNLPDLLGNYSLDRLQYYLEVEYPGYVTSLQKRGEDAPSAYALPWKHLEQFHVRHRGAKPSSTE